MNHARKAREKDAYKYEIILFYVFYRLSGYLKIEIIFKESVLNLIAEQVKLIGY